MCNRIIDQCVGSLRPVLITGSVMLFILGICLAGNTYYCNDLYSELDINNTWLSQLFWPQLVAALYLVFITLAGCLAAYYEHKEAIRVFALVSSLNFLLALVAIFLVHEPSRASSELGPILMDAQQKYNFFDKSPSKGMNPIDQLVSSVSTLKQGTTGEIAGNQTNSTASVRSTRDSGIEGPNTNNTTVINEVTATRMWDKLQQSKMCCGWRNARVEWNNTIPKSCCRQPTNKGSEQVCEKIDADHDHPCSEYVDTPVRNIMVASVLCAIVHLLLAVLTGLKSYRLYHYSETGTAPY